MEAQSFIACIMCKKKNLNFSYGLLAYCAHRKLCGLNLKLCHQASRTRSDEGKTNIKDDKTSKAV